MQQKTLNKKKWHFDFRKNMDTFSTLAKANPIKNQKNRISEEFASFGAIHLKNTSLEKSTNFWTKIVGMKLRKSTENSAEFGTETKTLVVVHQTAKTPFKKGYSGIYHFAIHAPNKGEFARMLHRLHDNYYPYSPVDHTMSKSLYLDDPDGINVEFTLETPERFKKVISDGGIKIEDATGNIRGASVYLDLDKILENLENKDLDKPLSKHTYIGHLHLYANNVQKANAFYKKLGFTQFNNFPEFMFADLGAGGPYQHRLAMNSWHGMEKPLAPADHAGMAHFQLNYSTKEKLSEALNNVTVFEEKNGSYCVYDPTGNKLLLTIEKG